LGDVQQEGDDQGPAFSAEEVLKDVARRVASILHAPDLSTNRIGSQKLLCEQSYDLLKEKLSASDSRERILTQHLSEYESELASLRESSSFEIRELKSKVEASVLGNSRIEFYDSFVAKLVESLQEVDRANDSELPLVGKKLENQLWNLLGTVDDKNKVCYDIKTAS
jgi:hypothetical protein